MPTGRDARHGPAGQQLLRATLRPHRLLSSPTSGTTTLSTPGVPTAGATMAQPWQLEGHFLRGPATDGAQAVPLCPGSQASTPADQPALLSPCDGSPVAGG